MDALTVNNDAYVYVLVCAFATIHMFYGEILQPDITWFIITLKKSIISSPFIFRLQALPSYVFQPQFKIKS